MSHPVSADAARVQRDFGTIEVMEREGDNRSVAGNFHLFYPRPCSNHCQRPRQPPQLRSVAAGLQIQHRKVVLDDTDIESPSPGPLS